MESSSSSSSNSNGPRPLATKPEYVRRTHTSKSGLLSSSTTPSAAPSITNRTTHELDHFSFKRPISDSLLQPNAKRARKLYRSVLHDQMFLLDLKEMWQTKLNKLRMEQVLLEQMCAYTQEDVSDVPPLFSQNDSMPLSNQQMEYHHQQRQSPYLQGKQRLEMYQQQQQMQRQNQHDDTYSMNLLTPASSAHPESSPSPPQSSIYLTADDVNSETNSVADTFYLPLSRSGRDRSRNSPISISTTPVPPAATAEIKATSISTPTTTIPDDDASNQLLEENGDNGSDTNNSVSNNLLLDLVGSENDSSGDDNGEEEDEETARRALTFMLAHYGNDL